MNPSDHSFICALRVCMSGTMDSLVMPVCCSSRSCNACGMTPKTSAPAASAASATTPISPARPPP